MGSKAVRKREADGRTQLVAPINKLHSDKLWMRPDSPRITLGPPRYAEELFKAIQKSICDSV